MGYDLHIVRREHWADDTAGSIDISLPEWLEYINSDPELELSNPYDENEEPGDASGFCTWTAYPADDKPWFDYGRGAIHTKNPDEDVIVKMLSISEALNARVQGDDGEIYELSDDEKIVYRFLESNDPPVHPKRASKKPWWKFW